MLAMDMSNAPGDRPVRIVDFLGEQDVIADLASATKEEVLAELCRPLARRGLDGDQLVEVLLRREQLGSTGIGDGVAIPHGTIVAPPGLYAIFGRSLAGIDFGALDGKPSRFFFTLFVSASSAGSHLKALARISRVFKTPAVREAILDAEDAAEIYRLIADADSSDEDAGQPR